MVLLLSLIHILLLLSLYTRQGSRKLLISAGVGMARLHLTAERFENPETPPMFCMLLRKHLVGARIDALTQPENERMVILELTARDELGVETKKRLAVELMGRSSNVVLVDGEGVIIDCLRRADFGEGAYRRLLPGMLYRLPPKPAKPNLLELSGEQLRAAIRAAATDKPGDKLSLIHICNYERQPQEHELIWLRKEKRQHGQKACCLRQGEHQGR